jgi:hypothetical protein
MKDFEFFYSFVLKNFFETSFYPTKKRYIDMKSISENYKEVIPNLMLIYDINDIKLFCNINRSYKLLLIIKNKKHIILRLNNDSKKCLIGFICDDLVFSYYSLTIEKTLEYLFFILD